MKRCRAFHLIWISLFSIGVTFPTSTDSVRICGRSLADALAIVCDERGYNLAFRPERVDGGDRRQRRGIVDECCHMGCTLSTLESYCRPAPSTTTPPDNLQIRKRSEHIKSWKDGLSDHETPNSREFQEHVRKFTYHLNDWHHNNKDDLKNDGTRHHKRRLFGHTDEEEKRVTKTERFYPLSTEQKPHHSLGYKRLEKRRPTGNKVKRNEIHRVPSSMEYDYSNIGFHSRSEPLDTSEVMAELAGPLIRHHRDKISAEKKHHRNEIRKRGKDTATTSQVGTISPYFLGRTLVSKATRKSLVAPK